MAVLPLDIQQPIQYEPPTDGYILSVHDAEIEESNMHIDNASEISAEIVRTSLNEVYSERDPGLVHITDALTRLTVQEDLIPFTSSARERLTQELLTATEHVEEIFNIENIDFQLHIAKLLFRDDALNMRNAEDSRFYAFIERVLEGLQIKNGVPNINPSSAAELLALIRAYQDNFPDSFEAPNFQHFFSDLGDSVTGFYNEYLTEEGLDELPPDQTTPVIESITYNPETDTTICIRESLMGDTTEIVERTGTTVTITQHTINNFDYVIQQTHGVLIEGEMWPHRDAKDYWWLTSTPHNATNLSGDEVKYGNRWNRDTIEATFTLKPGDEVTTKWRPYFQNETDQLPFHFSTATLISDPYNGVLATHCWLVDPTDPSWYPQTVTMMPVWFGGEHTFEEEPVDPDPINPPIPKPTPDSYKNLPSRYPIPKSKRTQ